MLLILVPFAKDLSAQDRIKVVEVNYELSQGHFTPSLAELIVHSNWQTVTSRSLLQDNRPFVIRIPTDAVFKDDSIRILSVASEATISFYRLDGSLTKVRDLLSNADKVHDRLSIELKKTQAINGYFFAEVNPSKAWIPGIQPSSSSGLRLLSTKVEDYDIYSSHFNQKRRWTEEASMLFLLGGIFIMGCYFGILFFSNRSEYIFGIYSAYLFFHSIYWAERITSISLPFFERNVDQLVVNAVSQICFHVAFTLLAHELLNFRAYYPHT